jgi:hypothetical protein
MKTLTKAIQALAPDLDFRLESADLTTLESLNGKPLPSVKDIEVKAKEIEAEITANLEAQSQAKAALLERLGITEDEAKLLLA